MLFRKQRKEFVLERTKLVLVFLGMLGVARYVSIQESSENHNLFQDNIAQQQQLTLQKADTSKIAPAQSPQTAVTAPFDLASHKVSLIYMGTKASNTGWYVDTLCLLNKKSLLVYGVGAGEDISWDVGLVEKYGATVHLFDPTEKSNRYTAPIVAKYDKLFHTAQGMSDKEGTITFALPANPNHVSMRRSDLATKDMGKTVTLPVNTLQNWMNERGHTYLDILKIDIEGSEYAVIEALVTNNFMPFTQLLVEYHQRFLSDKSRHAKVLQLLKKAGFLELWSQNGGQEVGYVKSKDLPYCSDGTSPRRANVQ